MAQGHIDGQVGVDPGMGLHVGVVLPEKFLCPLYCEALDSIDYLAAAVVPLSSIPFGVLVGQDGTRDLHDAGRHEVL